MKAPTPQLVGTMPPGGPALPSAAGSGSAAGLPHDIRGLLPYEPPWWHQALLVLAALAAVWALAWLVLYLIRRRRLGRGTAVPAVVDPWQALKERCQALAPRPPFAPGPEQEEFFFQLSLLLREAIELRTGIRATDLTIGELKGPLRRKLPLASGETEAVLGFLERADLVKFAGQTSRLEEAAARLAEIGRWIELLTPRSIDLPPGGEAADPSRREAAP